MANSLNSHEGVILTKEMACSSAPTRVLGNLLLVGLCAHLYVSMTQEGCSLQRLS